MVNMMEKNDREILIRTQDGMRYIEFEFPLEVMDSETASCEYYDGGLKGYGVYMGCERIGTFEEKSHAIHVMNYLLAKRNHYMFDDVGSVKSIILNVPTDEDVKKTPEENLINGIPVKGENNELQR